MLVSEWQWIKLKLFQFTLATYDDAFKVNFLLDCVASRRFWKSPSGINGRMENNGTSERKRE